MMSASRNKYLETSIQTASPAQLLIMLYDGAIRFCKQAIEALKASNYEEANLCLIKTQSIVNEFAITLDKDAEISQSLTSLYEYFNYQLVQANIHKKSEPVEEVLGYLVDLKEAWIQAAMLAKQAPAAAAK